MSSNHSENVDRIRTHWDGPLKLAVFGCKEDIVTNISLYNIVKKNFDMNLFR